MIALLRILMVIAFSLISQVVEARALSRHQFPSTIEYENLGSKVVLAVKEKQKSGPENVAYYEVSSGIDAGARKLKVAVSKHLVVTGNKELLKNDWSEIISGTSIETTLAEFDETVILLLSLPDWDLQTAIDKVKLMPLVLNVQPDFIQLRYYKASGSLHKTSAKTFNNPANKTKESLVTSRVAIIDDGFNLNHPALAKTKVVFQYDLDNKSLDASPRSEADFHGTMALGLLAAQKTGNIPAGLLPDAEFVLLRLTQAKTSNFVLAFYLSQLMASDVVNASWTLRYLPEPLKRLLDWQLERGTPGLIIAAAGNKNKNACQETALSQINGVMIIGSRDSSGEKASFSNYGECVVGFYPHEFITTSSDGISESLYEGTSSSTTFAVADVISEMK